MSCTLDEGACKWKEMGFEFWGKSMSLDGEKVVVVVVILV